MLGQWFFLVLNSAYSALRLSHHNTYATYLFLSVCDEKGKVDITRFGQCKTITRMAKWKIYWQEWCERGRMMCVYGVCFVRNGFYFFFFSYLMNGQISVGVWYFLISYRKFAIFLCVAQSDKDVLCCVMEKCVNVQKKKNK